MEVKRIRRTEDVQNIQSALELISSAGKLIDNLLGANKVVNNKNEGLVGYATSARDNVFDSIVELSNAMSDIISIDIRDSYANDVEN